MSEDSTKSSDGSWPPEPTRAQPSNSYASNSKHNNIVYIIFIWLLLICSLCNLIIGAYWFVEAHFAISIIVGAALTRVDVSMQTATKHVLIAAHLIRLVAIGVWLRLVVIKVRTIQRNDAIVNRQCSFRELLRPDYEWVTSHPILNVKEPWTFSKIYASTILTYTLMVIISTLIPIQDTGDYAVLLCSFGAILALNSFTMEVVILYACTTRLGDMIRSTHRR